MALGHSAAPRAQRLEPSQAVEMRLHARTRARHSFPMAQGSFVMYGNASLSRVLEYARP